MATFGVSEGLLELLARVPDPRKRRGVRHRIGVILAIALAATLTGARSFSAIAEWAADTPAGVRARLGVTKAAPAESTIRRCLQRLDPDRLDRLIGAWMWLRTSVIGGRSVIAFDGKTLRGARDAAGNLVHLLSGISQQAGVVLGQCAVGAKTNEIPLLSTLLDTMDITDAVITADALHRQRETADGIVARGGHYILTVKSNQPRLRDRLKSLPWAKIPILDATSEHGHGRWETRTLKATALADGIGFPHARQVLQLTRTTRRGRAGAEHVEVVYAVTSLAAYQASPEQIATWLRGHWRIESLHWVRDVTFDEDRSQVRTQAGPQVMATLRNTGISLLRRAGATNLAAATRHHARDPHRPVTLLLTS
jgi:predicted transposase YbfD/YdcC